MSSNAIETPPLAAQLESLSALIRRTEPFCQRISAVGMYIFMGLVILTFADVLLRYVIGSPISGSIEITEMLMSVVLFSSVAYTYWRRGHVSMDIVTGKLSELNKNRLGAITTVWSLAVVFFCITCMGKYAMTTTDTTSVWNMSYKPFIWFAVFGCVLLFLAMLSHLLDQLAATIRGGRDGVGFLDARHRPARRGPVGLGGGRASARHQRTRAGRHRHGVYVYHVFLGDARGLRAHGDLARLHR